MNFSNVFRGRERDITELFSATFGASEGVQEGVLIGSLADELLSVTPPGDIRVFTAWEGGALIGAAVFTRLAYAGDPRIVFLLSPMAVATARQGEGVGQALIRHALAELRAEGVDVAVTYGDPAFYGRVGFMPLSEATAPAPLPLSQPEGWIGQSLTAEKLTAFSGPATCVAALDDPRFW